MQSAYLWVIFHEKNKISTPFLAVLIWFPILGIIQNGGQMATIVSDVTGLQERNHP